MISGDGDNNDDVYDDNDGVYDDDDDAGSGVDNSDYYCVVLYTQT